MVIEFNWIIPDVYFFGSFDVAPSGFSEVLPVLGRRFDCALKSRMPCSCLWHSKCGIFMVVAMSPFAPIGDTCVTLIVGNSLNCVDLDKTGANCEMCKLVEHVLI